MNSTNIFLLKRDAKVFVVLGLVMTEGVIEAFLLYISVFIRVLLSMVVTFLELGVQVVAHLWTVVVVVALFVILLLLVTVVKECVL